jgi:transposase-like protein
MSPRKLTAADKKEIVKVYRSSADSTAALATRYGVSNSTVSRLLKSHIPEAEYETLMSEKRGQKSEGHEDEEEIFLDLAVEQAVAALEETTIPKITPKTVESLSPINRQVLVAGVQQSKPIKKSTQELRRVRRRSSALLEADLEQQMDALPEAAPKPVIKSVRSISIPVTLETTATFTEFSSPQLPSDGCEEEDEDNGEDLLALADILGEEMGGLLDEDEDEFGDEDDWSYELPPTVLATDHFQVQVLPLSAANLPRTCYIVIDKFAELVAKPLREFAELGNIPADEVPRQTLPIFDNHRVAKRFSSSHTNRVIKVPDSSLFQKTSRHLEAKGITRLLVDGQIYSLN